MAVEKYPLAKQGVFRTIQGEGSLMGLPMVFVRLAGCSIGCSQCDTDYRVHERLTAQEICGRVEAMRGKAEWIWVTGGEPADHDLWELFEELRLSGKVALATSGAKSLGGAGRLLDFISVSPHGTPADLKLLPWKPNHVHKGTQINLVPGLNGLCLKDWDAFDASGFEFRWVTPLWNDPLGIRECVEFVQTQPGWRLGVQAHKLWGLA